MRLIFSLTGACIFLWILSCAHPVPPTGGPEDKIKPYVKGVYPEMNSLNNSTELKIMLQFNEWINSRIETSARNGINISPPLSRSLKVRVDGPLLTMTSKAELDSNTTYSLTVSQEIKDINGNALYEPFQLVFSTGNTLDSGKLIGMVQYPLGSRGRIAKAGVKIGLYPLGKERFNQTYLERYLDSVEVTSEEPILWKEIPKYISGIDSLGQYSFNGVRDGKYRVFAFTDKNNDGRFNIQTEEAAFANRDVDVSSKEQFTSMTLVKPDTNYLQLMSVKAKYPNLLEVKFNKPVMEELRKEAKNYSIHKLDSASYIKLLEDSTFSYKALPTVPVKSVFENGKEAFPILISDSLMNADSYLLAVHDLKDSMGLPIDTSKNYLVFTFNPFVDTTEVKFSASVPARSAKHIPLDARIKLYYERPIPADSKKFMVKAGTDTLDIKEIQFDLNTAHIAVQGEFPSGSSIQVLELYPDTIVRVSREDTLALPDTTITEKGRRLFSFNTLKPITLGGFDGTLPGAPKDATVRIKNIKDKLYFSASADAKGYFKFDDVPDGQYFMEYFIDENKSNVWDQGSLKPFSYAEPYYRVLDTIRVSRNAILNFNTMMDEAQQVEHENNK